MPSARFVAALNEQVGHEFAAHQQYVAIAVHYDADTLPRLAAHFYAQAVEERNHAMMIVRYVMDAGAGAALVPGCDPPRTSFADVVEPVQLALDQERKVTGQVNALAALAREDGDYQGEQFLGWFLKEQVEEVAAMSDLLNVVRRARDNPLLAEEYLARETPGDQGEDPTAPPAAGGAL